MSFIMDIYNIRQIKKTWEDGATMWVVTGKDGLYVFHRNNIKDEKHLEKLLEPFFEIMKKNRKAYTIHSNR